MRRTYINFDIVFDHSLTSLLPSSVTSIGVKVTKLRSLGLILGRLSEDVRVAVFFLVYKTRNTYCLYLYYELFLVLDSIWYTQKIKSF